MKEANTGFILDVKRVTRDGGSYAIKCPHCGDIYGIDGDDMDELRYEQPQYACLKCDGWAQIHADARFVKEL